MFMSLIISYFLNSLFIFLLFIDESTAHSLVNDYSGFGNGFSHPILGLDHFLVMLGVGVWGAQMQGRRMWSLPITFPIIMSLGAIISLSNIFILFYIEYIILLSVIILGLFIFLKWLPNELVAIILISFFAIFHGYAHGNEIPKAIDPSNFILGFVISTGLIHLLGILLGYVLEKFYNGLVSRALGMIISLSGIIIASRILF